MTAGDPASEAAARLADVSHEVNNNSALKMDEKVDEPASAGAVKYSLRARSIKKRIETEHRQVEPKVRQPRAKARPPPLSKYRRKTANARERDRMKDINTAFDLLEQSLPDPALHTQAEKVTKITVLRLAIDYIKAMSELLDSDAESGADSPGRVADSPASVGSSPSSVSTSSSVSSEWAAGELPYPLDNIEVLTDFQLPAGLDLLLDLKSDSDGLDFSCSDFSDFSP